MQGHYLSYLPLCSRNEPVFLATCSPVAMPETREAVVQGSTTVFTAIHSMDMKFIHVDKMYVNTPFLRPGSGRTGERSSSLFVVCATDIIGGGRGRGAVAHAPSGTRFSFLIDLPQIAPLLAFN